jgi:hypothetical protein
MKRSNRPQGLFTQGHHRDKKEFASIEALVEKEVIPEVSNVLIQFEGRL